MKKVYKLSIDGQSATADEAVLRFTLGRIAQILSEETEEMWLAHINESDLLSDGQYFRCERHGVVIYAGELPDLDKGLVTLALQRHQKSREEMP